MGFLVTITENDVRSIVGHIELVDASLSVNSIEEEPSAFKIFCVIHNISLFKYDAKIFRLVISVNTLFGDAYICNLKIFIN